MRGDYILRVQVHAYDNPTNTCPVCGLTEGCCDIFITSECTGLQKCDNEFFYCVRPLGSPSLTLDTLADTISERSISNRAAELQCLQTQAPFRSETNVDGASIDFSQAMFLGVPNPLQFQVTASEWEVSP